MHGHHQHLHSLPTRRSSDLQDRRRDSKGDHVGERIELNPEIARGPGQTGHPAVHAIQERCDEHRDGGPLIFALHAANDGDVAAQQIPGREQAGDEIGTATEAGSRPNLHARSLSTRSARSTGRARAMTVRPPFTLSPTDTSGSTPGGSIRSVRDPNRIRPMRSPLPTASPGRFVQTMRRARTPATWVTPKSPVSEPITSRFRSFSPLARPCHAGWNRPRVYTASRTVPLTGERLM